MTALLDKLKNIAAIVDSEKPKLHFFALVHRVDTPDRWDLLVSSDKLEPWSMEALKYIVGHLKKELTAEEIIRISQVVALPRDNKVIASLSQNQQIRSGEFGFLHPSDRFDRAYVIWPPTEARQAVHATGLRRVS